MQKGSQFCGPFYSYKKWANYLQTALRLKGGTFVSPQDYTQEYNLDGNLYQPADLSPAAITALHACEKDLQNITGQKIILVAYQEPLS